MVKILYKKSDLNKLVKPGIDNAKSNLKNAISYCNSFDIPNDYSNKDYLNNLSSTLDSQVTRLDNVLTLLSSSSTKFDLAKTETENNISNIENFSVSLRQSAIK